MKQVSGIPPYDRLEAKRKRVQIPPLYGVAEVSEALDVQAPNLQFIKDLPQPVQKVRATRLWLADEIDEFAKVYNVRRLRRSHSSAPASEDPIAVAAEG